MARSGFGTVSSRAIQVRTVLMGMVLLVSCSPPTASLGDTKVIYVESLEWLTDNCDAIVVVEPIAAEDIVPTARLVNITQVLKIDPRFQKGRILRIEDSRAWQYIQSSVASRSILFYTKSKDEGFAIHQVVGWNRLGPQPAGSISLIAFDRWGCLVTSIEQATGIVASRAGRRTKPTVDWNPAVPLSHRPPNGAFHRTAERSFGDIIYDVVVPADPDFAPFLQFQWDSSLFNPGERELVRKKYYSGNFGPSSKRSLHGEEATATLIDVLGEISPRPGRDHCLIHARRTSEAYNDGRLIELSPDGKTLILRLKSWETSGHLVDAQTGEILFPESAFRFSPTGRHFVCYGEHGRAVRRTADCQTVVDGIKAGTNMTFSPDGRRLFLYTYTKAGICEIEVYDLATGQQIASSQAELRNVSRFETFAGASYILIRFNRAPELHLLNWRTGEIACQLAADMQWITVAPNDRSLAYVRQGNSGDYTLFLESFPERHVLKQIPIPTKPANLQFIAGGKVAMTTFALNVADRRRDVALLYGVETDELDGETVSWTPADR